MWSSCWRTRASIRSQVSRRLGHAIFFNWFQYPLEVLEKVLQTNTNTPRGNMNGSAPSMHEFVWKQRAIDIDQQSFPIKLVIWTHLSGRPTKWFFETNTPCRLFQYPSATVQPMIWPLNFHEATTLLSIHHPQSHVAQRLCWSEEPDRDEKRNDIYGRCVGLPGHLVVFEMG